MQHKNIRKFDKLEPIEAIQAWLEGGFTIGDEDALIKAIRKDSQIKLPDDDITDIIIDAMEEGLDATACLRRLRES
jgi:hypothetical protein